ncbi:MAG: sigma-70 family RNA polymerase sigma factor [Elusimicrobia bacterium]|nr:sigma-70 family RNA polymerase sigma factor [Elusimicrobiota bacterium]
MAYTGPHQFPAHSQYDLTKQYFQGIQRLPTMTREDLHKHWKLVKRGNAESKRILMESNLKLVIPIAKKYQRTNLDFLDLIEEGNLGLMHAIDKFDPSRGFRFSTYASYWIEQSIRRAIEEQSKTIRIPPHAWEALRKWFKAWDRLHNRLGRDPTVTEMSKQTGLTSRQVKGIVNAAEAAKEMGSFENPIGDDENLVLEEIIKDREDRTPDKIIGMLKLNDELERAFKELVPRERQVLTLRFGLKDSGSNTLEEVGRKLDLSRERVRQLETRALERLRRIAQRMGLIESGAGAAQLRRSEKAKSVLRLSRGIIWSKQMQPLGKKLRMI